MCNYKTNGLMLAKKQFLEDLQNDKDFLEHKEKAYYDKSYGFSYGTMVAGVNVYVLNIITPSSQTLISQFLKSLKK
jgi:hypothetical protein